MKIREPKYIEVEGIMRACYDSFLKTGNKAYSEIFALVEAVPAADVVEVVRCKDCEYLDYVDEHEKWCMGRGYPATMVKDDGYCEIGKRKEAS